MPTLPWISVTSQQSAVPVVVMASRLQVTSLLQVPRFLLDAFRVRRQALRAPGALGVSLVAHPLRREFYTLSAWRDRDAITEFVRSEPHKSVMSRHRTSMADSKFVFYELAAEALPPTWDDAHTRLTS